MADHFQIILLAKQNRDYQVTIVDLFYPFPDSQPIEFYLVYQKLLWHKDFL